jgi:hypothetical protein
MKTSIMARGEKSAYRRRHRAHRGAAPPRRIVVTRSLSGISAAQRGGNGGESVWRSNGS